MGRAGDGGGIEGVLALGLAEAGTRGHLQCLQSRSCGPATTCPQGCWVADASSLHQLLHSHSLPILSPVFWVGRDQGCERNGAPQETASLLPGQHGCAGQRQVGGHRGLPAPLPAGTHPGTGWQRDQGGGSPGGSGRRVPRGCWCRAGCSCAGPGHTRRCLAVGKRAARRYSRRGGRRHSPVAAVWAALPAAPQPLQCCTSGCAPRAGQGQSCPGPPCALQLAPGPRAGRAGGCWGCPPPPAPSLCSPRAG